MLSHLDILAFSQTIQDFYQNNKQIINTLIVGGGGATLIALGTTFFKVIRSVRKRHRFRRIPRNTFAFEVIKPQTKNLKQQIFGGKYDDSLADHNIPYQQRVANRNIRKELQQILEEHRWLLILGRTGIGKTREVVELAERYNNLGWTVFYFKPGEWLDVPARPPKEFGTGRKLLFLLDDLNRRMYRSGDEKNPKAEESLSEPLNVPLQERLLNALEKYENFCGKAEILVIATARNEKESQFQGEPNPWEQLQWERYPKLWQKFTVYDLPEPSDDAIIDVLAATISNTDITPKPEQYPKIASSNDRTFRNVVENLRRLENDNLPLNIGNYRPSLGKTWEKRYQEAVKRYPAAKYVYDAVDLLRQFDISLEKFIIEPTANLMVKGNIWERLWCRFKIRSALNYLVEIERIKNPRDGQIEAKGYQVEGSEYASSLTSLFLKITDKYPEKLEDLRMGFGKHLLRIKCYEEALNYFTRLIKLFPQNAYFWNGRGNALLGLKCYEEAINCSDKALEINPSYEKIWNSRGNILLDSKRYDEAIICYDKALEINPSCKHGWNNRGNALLYLKRYKEAITHYDKALEIKPSYKPAWNNRGNALLYLKRYEEAITCYDKVL
ncbi:MAG: tetratricopeptide repeat protein [Cyanobacteria bacterium P01_H01_bin.150]